MSKLRFCRRLIYNICAPFFELSRIDRIPLSVVVVGGIFHNIRQLQTCSIAVATFILSLLLYYIRLNDTIERPKVSTWVQ